MSYEQERTAYEEVVSQLINTTPTQAGHMFGMPCLKIQGKAFAGFYKGAMVFKLSGEAHSNALAMEGVHLFDPSGMQKPMKAWVVIPYTSHTQWETFAQHALSTILEKSAQ